MKSYIGAKIIKAEEMDKLTFLEKIKGEEVNRDNLSQEGYHVQYPDGYDSWSPKHVFEEAYREISEGEKVIISSSEADPETA